MIRSSGFFTSQTECDPYCGDGIVTPGEVCDSGSACQGGILDGDACNTEAAENDCVNAQRLT